MTKAYDTTLSLAVLLAKERWNKDRDYNNAMFSGEEHNGEAKEFTATVEDYIPAALAFVNRCRKARPI